MGRVRTRVERLEQLQNSSAVSNVTGTPPIVVTTPSVGVRNVALDGSLTQYTDTMAQTAVTGQFLQVNSRISALINAPRDDRLHIYLNNDVFGK